MIGESSNEGWPSELRVSQSGDLVFEACNLVALARERSTPLWVVSRSMVEENYRALHAAFCKRYANCEIAYSLKANSTMAMVRLLSSLGAKIDASAEYELELALRCGVPPHDIILNGNGKSDAALVAAVRLGVRQINIDSLDEVIRLNAIAQQIGTEVPCTARVQLTYDGLLRRYPIGQTPGRIGAGKFGSSVRTGQAMETIAAVVQASNLRFCGLHHHVGFVGYQGGYSIERDLAQHRECVRELCLLANDVNRRFGVDVERLDLGGGFRSGTHICIADAGASGPTFYPLPQPEEYAEAVLGAIEENLDASHSPLVQLETGGYQIANAVLMLTTVNEVKDVPGESQRRYVVVDGSMKMFITRAHVTYPVVVIQRPLAAVLPEWPVEVVGQTCAHDTIVADIRLPSVQRGDILAILNQGAYCETESTQFNSFPRPEVMLVDRDFAYVVKRRETLDDVLMRDRIPPKLEATL